MALPRLWISPIEEKPDMSIDRAVMAFAGTVVLA
jgi:hypothetical protein